AAPQSVYEEKRRFGSERLQGNHRRSRSRRYVQPHHRHQLFNRRSLQKIGEKQLLTEFFFHLTHQARRRQRMSANLKKIVAHADGPLPQDLLPYTSHSGLELVARSDKVFLPVNILRLWPRQRASIHFAIWSQWH